MLKRLVLTLTCALIPVIASAQSTTTVNTELPTASAPGDSASNPTVPGVAAYGQAWSGSVWSRVRFGSAGTASSQVWTVQGIASMTPLNVAGTTTPADSFSNPTTAVSVFSLNGCWNSTSSSWDRCRAATTTEATHDTGLGTMTSVVGSVSMFRASTAVPTDVSADNDAVAPWATRKGALVVALQDPCGTETKTTAPFSLTARGVVIAASASKKNYVCSITVVAGAAEVFNLVEGTGTTCQTGTAAVVGSTTAANGLSFAANGGFSAAGGSSTVIAGIGTNVDTCIVPSGSSRLSGYVTYVQR